MPKAALAAIVKHCDQILRTREMGDYEGAANGLPKYMEWYSAFGLMVTLVWLYLEIIRLLSKLRGDDRR